MRPPLAEQVRQLALASNLSDVATLKSRTRKFVF
jgi:hypothetical protein